MNKKNNTKIIKFPSNLNESERQIEAILFAAEEPLDIETIQSQIQTRANLPKNIRKPPRAVQKSRNKFNLYF